MGLRLQKYIHLQAVVKVVLKRRRCPRKTIEIAQVENVGYSIIKGIRILQ